MQDRIKNSGLILALFFLPLLAIESFAEDISVVAISNGKAMFVVDDKPPKMFTVGSTVFGDTKLIAVDESTATLESKGKKTIVYLGHAVLRASTAGKNMSVTLQANEHGHFVTQGQINGHGSVRMLIDTGASYVAMPAGEAQKLGIDYRNKGRPGRMNTANGPVSVYLIKLDSIRLGDVEVFQVEAAIHENDLPITLLGMSFLKRLTMLREGTQMVLTKKL
jgi:aspartyl protease family protein